MFVWGIGWVAELTHPVAQGHQCFKKKPHQTEHVILIRTKLLASAT